MIDAYRYAVQLFQLLPLPPSTTVRGWSFYRQYFGEEADAAYSVYFSAVIDAIQHNNRVFRLKSGLTAAAIIALLATLVIMAAMPIKA